MHRSNQRLRDDLAVLQRHRPEIVIASVGSPEPVLRPLHNCGTLVVADVASLRHAEKAVEAGADGLVLLTAGAGGQTGWLNPLAFVRAVRTFYYGPLVLAGGISDGCALLTAELMGYMGTKFIATCESMASEAYKAMLVSSKADDVLLTRAFTGLETNILRPPLIAAGLDPADLPVRGMIDASKDIEIDAYANRPKRWRNIWSTGNSVSGVSAVLPVAELVAHTTSEYAEARRAFASRLGNLG